MSRPSPGALFAALGDETRLLLVDRLCERGPLSLSQLTAGTGITRQAVTKHLQVLADAGLVSAVRRGREHVWALDPERFAEARSRLDQVSQQWDAALLRLKTFVEDHPSP